MIDDEVSEILELDVETRAIRVNELADEFRCGRVANEIMVLLCSPNSRFVSIGVYIVN